MFVGKEAAGMSNLPHGIGAQTPETQTTFVASLLSELLRRPEGLTLTIDGEDEGYTIYSGDISNVKVNSAWIGFKIGSCAFRTKEPKDRDAFWALLVNGSADGEIRFQKTCGTLNRTKNITTPEVKMGFVPRSQYRRERKVTV